MIVIYHEMLQNIIEKIISLRFEEFRKYATSEAHQLHDDGGKQH